MASAECVKSVKTAFSTSPTKNCFDANEFLPHTMRMKIKTEIDINDIVALRIALNNADRRINELMNDKPDWRKLYEFDKDSVEKAKKVVANLLANS